MKYFTRLLYLFSVALLFSQCGGPGAKEMVENVQLDNIGLYDQHDNFHRLYYHDAAEAIVLYVQGNECPIVRNGFKTYEEIAEEYAAKGFVFFMVNSNPQDNRQSIEKEAEEFDMSLPILIDDKQFMADNLNLTRTAETIVINPNDWSIYYRGPIDDQLGYEAKKGEAKENYLRDALDAFNTEAVIAETYRSTKGCSITRRSDVDDYSDITYTEDIGPLLKEKCVNCHKPEGIAPWAMTNYNAVFGWSNMIKEVLVTRRMPPWQADPKYGHFSNAIDLTDEDIKTIVKWVDNGRKRGEGEDPLLDVTAATSEWVLGEPDQVFDLAQEDIPANGIIDYRYQTFPLEIEEDIKINAIEVVPGNTEVLHHVLATIEYPEGYETPVDRKRGPWLDGVFATWAPGAEPEVFPAGTARTIPAGSTVHFQLHYTTNGKEQSDQTKIGLHYAEKEDLNEFVSLGPANFRFKLKPNVDHQEVVAIEKFDNDLTLYGMFPHMHYRGKSMRFTLISPDGSEETLLNVPDYNFNWQRYYNLVSPRFIPKGSQLRIDAVFDNSDQNDYNPDPTATVVFGEQTFDEMMIGYISFVWGEYEGNLSMAE